MTHVRATVSRTCSKSKGSRSRFRTSRGLVQAVDDLSFSIREGETLAIVGESGCGKSTAALACLRLIPAARGHDLTRGPHQVRRSRLLALGDAELRSAARAARSR